MSYKFAFVSKEDLVKYLSKQGFEAKRQTSSHVVVQKEWRVFSVPLHRELKERNIDRDPQAGRDRCRGFQAGIPVRKNLRIAVWFFECDHVVPAFISVLGSGESL